ncbi:hypothetical protein WKV44_02290 [Spirochaetia bacterium 38H-sp]|uniref:TP-1001-like C-terminal domain-containing protein n=1 Tax=Rarispira pelagica TaxID=3141764 RepID=A0ABU9U9M4_9SPIR
MIPPTIADYAMSGENTGYILFSEPVIANKENLMCNDGFSIKNITITDSKLEFQLDGKVEPGKRLSVDGEITDKSGNHLSFLLFFYGFNPNIPHILINEFTTQGSSSHPDCVELFLLSAGNIGGIVLYEGTDSDWDQRFIFPSLYLEAGSFVVLHTKPDGTTEEKNETTAPDVSGGKDASSGGWDFWLSGGKGLSGNNGVISLYTRVGGELLDAVVYSTGTSSRYQGFGTKKIFDRAQEIFKLGGWESTEEILLPEFCIDPDPSTSTRSINRASVPVDTNSKLDWHIVPTSQSSFGSVNSDEVY